MNYPTICISSKDGAGAQEIAVLAATSLGFRVINEEIVASAAVEAGVDKEAVADIERRKSTVIRLIDGLALAAMGSSYVVPSVDLVAVPASDELRGMIRTVLESTAVAGNAVIVAHAASLALAERDDVLRVFLTAPLLTRERRLAETLGIDSKEAAKTVKRSDAARADYIKRFYGVSAELPTHYDLVINTEKIAPADAAGLIVQAADGHSD